jgi:hypothetical protein
MAYLHCHNCGWSQDDFWYKGYNPITKIWRNIKWLWKPTKIGFDKWFLKHSDGKKHNYIIPLWTREGKDWTYVFSWNWLLLELEKEIKCILNQRYWTYKAFLRKKDAAMCPKCKSDNLDID